MLVGLMLPLHLCVGPVLSFDLVTYSQDWRLFTMNLVGLQLPRLGMHYVFAMIFAMCLLLSSCGSSTKSVELAQQSVGLFHAQLDTEQYAAAYAASDEKLHKATSESDFVRLLEA